MSRPISYTSAVTVNPNSFDADTWGNYYSGATSGYNGTTNTTQRAQFRLRTTAQTCYYGFSVIDIPSIATINSVTCSVRGYVSSASYYPSLQLYSNTTAKGSATNITNTSSNITNLSTGTWTTEELLSARLCIKTIRGSSGGGNQRYFYFYGADLTVNYSVNGVEYEITINNSTSATTEPTGTTYVFGGENQNVFFISTDTNSIEIKDNSIDIKNNLIYYSPGTSAITSNPSYFDYTNGTVTDENEPLTDTASTTYSQLLLRTNVYMVYGFDISIPDLAVIDSVSCVAKYQRSATSTSINNLTIQLYCDKTPKGNAYEINSTSTAVSTANLTVGTWTTSELKSLKIRLSGNYSGSNNYYLRFYGANLTINYTIANAYYSYTISSISADHVISISEKSSSTGISIKDETWKNVTAVYKKVNGSWGSPLSNPKEAFTDGVYKKPDGTLYIKKNQ